MPWPFIMLMLYVKHTERAYITCMHIACIRMPGLRVSIVKHQERHWYVSCMSKVCVACRA